MPVEPFTAEAIEVVFFDGSAHKVGNMKSYHAAAGFLWVYQNGSGRIILFPLCNVRQIDVLGKTDGE